VTEIQEGIRHGVRKVNIDTDLRLAATGAVRKFLAENPANFDPRKFLTAAMHAMKEVCRSRFLAFGTAGWGRNITPSNHETMAVAYADGRFASRPRQQ
jgi:fructose-bisphosphate aldolase class II